MAPTGSHDASDAHPLAVVPVQKGGFVAGPSDFAHRNRSRWNGGGAFRPGGAADPSQAATMEPGARLSAARRAAAEAIPEGLFCGRFRAHFGHFLAESIGRLWALDRLDQQVTLVWFADPREPAGLGATAPTILALLGITNPVRIITGAIRVERLHLAASLNDPVFGVPAHPAFQSWLADRLALRSLPAGDSPALYLSRNALPDNDGRYLGEATLETGLVAEGYRIIHPETLSLKDQITSYLGARRIVMAEGSPMHLLALLDVPGQEIAMILRRPKVVSSIPPTAASFRRARFSLIRRTEAAWVDPAKARILHRVVSQLDMPGVWSDLARLGLIADAGNKPVPDVAALLDERTARAANRTRAISAGGI